MTVKINGETGETFKNDFGVPQGSCSSPSLFLFITELLHFCLKDCGELNFYADDSYLLLSLPKICNHDQIIQNTIDKITETMINLGFIINEQKSEVMAFHNANIGE